MELIADIHKTFREGFTVDARIHIGGDAPITILFGPSGAGKTTILRCIAGLERASGEVVFNGERWTDLPPQRRPIGYVFQDYALFPHLNVQANVAYGLGNLSRSERDRRADRVSRMMQIEDLKYRRPSELSGGQQQRVALARALAREPALLLLDEPFAALDAASRELVRSEVGRLLRSLRIPTIVVTHDWVDALALGDHMIAMSRGRILQTGKPQDVLTRPQYREVAAVVGVETVVTGRAKRRSGGVVVLEVGSAELFAADPQRDDLEFHVCIRGEDVTLERGRAERSSARNHLRGTVKEIVPAGILMKVVIDVGFSLIALVTRQAADDLGLTAGAEVYAVFKASAVHLIAK